MDYITDTSRIDSAKAQSDLDQSEQFLQEKAETQRYLSATKEIEEQKLAEQQAEQEKPSVGKELGNAVVGGLADAVSDVITLPERAVDMFNGEMQEQGADYKPDWNPLNPDQFETQTWWGGLIRGGINLSTLLIPVAGIAGKVGWLAKAPVIIRGAAVGGAVDLITAQSQGDNMSSMIVENFPVMDNVLGPLATKEDDHPLLKTLKNVVEGMGIGSVIDSLTLLRGLKKGDPESLLKASADVEARNKSVEKQTIEKGRAELNDPGFRGHKNKIMAEPHQGSPNSTASPLDVQNQLNKIDSDISAERGSTDQVVTPNQAERVYLGSGKEAEDVLRSIAKEMLSDERYTKMMNEVRTKKSSFKELFGPALERANIIVNGRNADTLNANQFWDEVFPEEFQARTGKRTVLDENRQAVPLGDDFDINYIRPEDVLSVDIAVGSMIKQIRDLAQASKEMVSFKEILEGDGPLKTIADRVVTGLALTRRSRYLTGLQLQQLKGPGGKAARKQVLEELDNMHSQSVQAMDMVMQMIRKDDSQSFINAWVETLSKAKDINNLEDLDKFMRKVHTGGEINGRKRTGQIIREMQSVMINSILSGFKTPVRAFLGTAFNIGLRNMSQTIGAALRLDAATFRSSVASTSSLISTIPESFEVFKSRLQSNWSGDFTKLGNRYIEYERRLEDFTRLERWVETRGTSGDKAAFRITKLAHQLNNNPIFTFNSNMMNAEDAAFDVIMSRARAREKAVREVLETQKTVNINFFKDDELMKSIEDRYFKQIIDGDGLISDDFVQSAAKEVKLNQELSGFGAKMEEMFNASPWAKPFFLFARTGINGVAMTTKYTPGLNLLLTKQRNILRATADNLENVRQYGINTAEDLANEKALQLGRQVLGTGVTFMAAQHYLSGGLRGNGPEDRQLRQAWIDAGWTPRSINIGGTWVSLESFEPFNTMLYAVADIGDNMQLMGPEWAEQSLLRVSAAATTGLASKTYMEGFIQLVDLFNGKPFQLERIAGSLMNNTVPLAGLRNDIGKLFSDGMREVNGSIFETIRNRNLLTEGMALDGGLPFKFDLLNGERLRDYHPITRFYNMISPIQFNLDAQSPGRDLFFDSNYDMRTSIMSSPTGISLAKHPKVRAMFAEQIGKQNIEKQLDALASRSDVKASIKQMQKDLEDGKREIDPRDYVHNRLIKQIMDKARKKAWAEITNSSDVQELIKEQQRLAVQQGGALRNTTSAPSILIPTR